MRIAARKIVRRLVTFIGDSGSARGYSVALASLTIMAALGRLALISQPMRRDEAKTFLDYAGRSIQVVLSDYQRPNNHIFHSLLVYVSYRLLGNQPWIVRLPAFAAGVLMVPAAYAVTKALYGKQPAILTAGLVASSSALIEYSTQARGYTLVCLITLLLLALAVRLKQSRNWVAWGAFVVLSAIGFYTIPIMLFPFGAITAWLALSWLVQDASPARDLAFVRDLVLAAACTGAITLLLYMPVFVTQGVRAVTDNTFVSPLVWQEFVSLLPHELLRTWQHWDRSYPAVLSALLFAGFAGSLLLHRRLTNHKVPIPLIVCAWCGIVVLARRVAPWPRVWLFSLPLFLMAASAGLIGILTRIRPKSSTRLNLAFTAVVLVLSLAQTWNVVHGGSVYYSRQMGTLRAAPEIALFLRDYVQDGDMVVAPIPSDHPLRYYLELHGAPSGYLYGGADEDFRRAIVIVNTTHGHTLEGDISEAGLTGAVDMTSATLTRQYESADVYELHALTLGRE